jgi:hypothetical protein
VPKQLFTLEQHGDRVEHAAWPLFVHAEFPQYEEFWQVFVVALTGRVHDVREIGFRPQQELVAEGRSEWHVEVAQLHYTTLLHLVRVFQLLERRVHDRDSFVEAIVRLDAATDTAFELLGHCLIDRGKSKSWDEIAGMKVRRAWDAQEGHPFKSLQDYRNSLLHGRVRPEHEVRLRADRWQTKVPFYPTFEKMANALDWREASIDNAAPADQLVEEAWSQVLDYLRAAWDTQLLPWARETFKAPAVPGLAAPLGQSILGAGARAASADAPAEYHGGSVTFTQTRVAPPTNPPE